MTRKLSVLLVLAFFVMSLGSVAFAAKAKVGAYHSSFTGEIAAPKMITLIDKDGSGEATSAKQPTSQPTALGYFMMSEINVGSTDFDWQSNDRQQRQVVMGINNKIHTVFIHRSVDDPSSIRSVYYNGYENSVTDPISSWNISPIPGTGGYGSISIGPNDSLAVAAYHYTKQGVGADTRPRTQIGRQGGEFSTSFLMFDYPSSALVMPKILNCQGIKTGLDTLEGGYIWPSIAGDVNGSGVTIAHVLARESAPSYTVGTVTTTIDTTGKASLVYFKTQPNATVPVTTCGFLIDSVAGGINYDIAASPISSKVAAVYLHPKAWTGYDLGDNDDVVYRESNDLGENWGVRVAVTNFRDTEEFIPGSGRDYRMRASEVSALYDNSDCLHVLYLTYWTSTDHYYLIYPARIYHWSSCDAGCRVMLQDGKPKDVTTDVAAWWPYTGRPPLGQNIVSKISLAQCTVGASQRLYAVYTLYPDSSGLTGNTHSDRSATPVLNGDVVVQGSTDGTGALWGPVVNVTNTRSDACTPNTCFSEQFTNAAPYTSDSLRIQYLLDKDAGSFIQSAAGGTSSPQGIQTDNPMIIKSYPCFAVDLQATLAASPTEVRYPNVHVKKNVSTTQNILLTNTGNKTANWTSSVGAATWISVPGSGSVLAGCVNTATVTATLGPKSTEGLYQGVLTFTYDAKTLNVPIDLYVFDNWFLPQDVVIRTASNKLAVNQAGQAAHSISGSSFTYFANPDSNFITDASLILGNSKDNLSWLIFEDGQGAATPANNFGRLYALSNTTADSTTFTRYRVAYGKGTNRDSTVGFDVRWYAAKHVDSADFYIGHFEVYKGVKDPTGTVAGLDIAFACDWDVPSDTSSDNTIITDPARQAIILQGQYTSYRQQGYAASAAYVESGTTLAPIVGGFAWGNNQQVYAERGYIVDSVWKYMQATTNYNSTWSDGDSIGDMSIVMVVAKNYSVTPTSRLKFDVILAAKRAAVNPSGLAGINLALDQGKDFLSKYGRCSACGDANGDGSVDISDVVFLIAHIFSGGAAPGWCNKDKGMGDANGDGSVDISDAVFLIARIFSGGAPPHCPAK